MTMPGDQAASLFLRRLIVGTRHLFLDFDGPICAVFAGTPCTSAPE
jgi:hypothetical protein